MLIVFLFAWPEALTYKFFNA